MAREKLPDEEIARKAAATRKVASALRIETARRLRRHHKIFAGGAIVAADQNVGGSGGPWVVG